MVKKSDTVREFVAQGEYKKALSIVKGFRLGISREDISQMTRAYECMVRPEFYKQIGVEPDAAIAEGVKILIAHYGRTED